MAQLSNAIAAARDLNFSRQQQQQQQQQQQIQLARPGFEEFLSFYNQQQRLQQRRDDVSYEGIRAIYSSRDGDDATAAAAADQSHGSLSLGSVLRRSSGIANLEPENKGAISVAAGEWHATTTAGLNRAANTTTNSGNDSHQHQADEVSNIQQQQTNLSDEANKSLQSGTIEDMVNMDEQQKRQQMIQQLTAQQQQQVETMSFNMRQRTSSGNTIACQDCGNQAKKDCIHMRCRTCCKSRGFECATHVRSTWVPAAKRRERQHAELAAIVSGQPLPKSKRARTLATLAGAVSQLQGNTINTNNTNTNSSFQSVTAALAGSVARHAAAQASSDQPFNPLLAATNQVAESMLLPGTLPLEIKTQALFQCVRVSSLADGQDEYAYRAVVRIGGRVFKGLLHDHGSSERDNVATTSIVSELQLGGARTAASTLAMTSGLTDLGIYAAPGSAILGGKESNMPGPF